MSGGVRFAAKRKGDTSSKKRRSVGDSVSNLTGKGIEPGPSETILMSLTITLTNNHQLPYLK